MTPRHIPPQESAGQQQDSSQADRVRHRQPSPAPPHAPFQMYMHRKGPDRCTSSATPDDMLLQDP